MLEAKKAILDISTGHVSNTTRIWLDEQAAIAAAFKDGNDSRPIMTIAGFGYGWFTTANPPDAAADLVPADLCTVLEFARGAGCDYVLFDRDADKIDGLPEFDW